jgi:DNA-binding NtrC family response regulator
MVSEGRFRADLYDRLNILNLETVPLRLQKAKIKHLLLDKLNAEQFAVGRAVPFEISIDAVRVLENYDWRGNFRELINFATRLAVECLDDAIITTETVQRVLQREIGNEVVFSKTGNLVMVTFDPKSDDLDTIYLKAAGIVIRHVIAEHNGNMRSAAEMLKVNHSTISRILEKYNRTYDQKPFHTPRKMMSANSAVAIAA